VGLQFLSLALLPLPEMSFIHPSYRAWPLSMTVTGQGDLDTGCVLELLGPGGWWNKYTLPPYCQRFGKWSPTEQREAKGSSRKVNSPVMT
jgi:hypothetical protein